MLWPRPVEILQNICKPIYFWILNVWNKPLLRFFSRKSITEMLESAGFEDIQFHYVKVVGWMAPAPVYVPKLRIPGWLYPLRCVVIEAGRGKPE